MSQILQIRLTIGTEACNVKHEARTLAGFGLDGKSSQFLERINDFTVLANEVVKSRGVLGNDLNQCAAIFDIDFNIAVKISDIEKLFQVVGCEFAFFLQARQLAGRIFAHSISSIRGCLMPWASSGLWWRAQRFFFFAAARRALRRSWRLRSSSSASTEEFGFSEAACARGERVRA